MTTDTKAVPRWDLWASSNSFAAPEMLDVADGDYILFTDHERVVGELESKIVTGGAISGAAMTQITRLAIERDTLRAALGATRGEVEGLKELVRRMQDNPDFDFVAAMENFEVRNV